jgi:flagellar protein FlbD
MSDFFIGSSLLRFSGLSGSRCWGLGCSPSVIPFSRLSISPGSPFADNFFLGPLHPYPTNGRTRGENMIQLTRLNNKPLAVNSDLIKFVEQSPDTLITLITGEKIVVRETSDEVFTRIIEFRRSVMQGIPSAWDSSALHPSMNQMPGANEPEAER